MRTHIYHRFLMNNYNKNNDNIVQKQNGKYNLLYEFRLKHIYNVRNYKIKIVKYFQLVPNDYNFMSVR